MDQNERIRRIVERPSGLASKLGLRILSADPDRIVAELDVTEIHNNRNGHMHGGALMAIADELGGTATFLSITESQGTTTMESKTNFFRPVEIGDRIRTETTALHKGQRTMVWQTRIFRGDGKLAAIVTQTQMVF